MRRLSKFTSFIIIILPFKTYALGEDIKYSWLEHNDKYDVMVGISVDGKPVSCGVLISNAVVITSANPLERINDIERIWVHTINGDPNVQKSHGMAFGSRDQCKRTTGKWATFGFDDRHAPHHDIMFVTFKKRIEINNHIPRHPNLIKFNRYTEFQSGGTFAIAGFGFIDRLHVKQNYELELVEYEYDTVYENCWEWFPSIWGNFICLSNIEHFVGISSGAGLFYNGLFVGIGCFAVKRGSEGVLVFTDYRKYEQQNILKAHHNHT